MTTISRAIPLLERRGRIIEGVSYQYAVPSLVHDEDPEDLYYEQILRGADTKTIRDRAARRDTFPLLVWHSRSVNRGQFPPEQIGDVAFNATDEALEFKAVFRSGKVADEVLEMVPTDSNPTGPAGDVSISYVPRFDIDGVHEGRRLVSRSEIAIRELSVCPTGTGLHDGARILVARAAAAKLDTAAIDARLRLLDL
jgi:hypothetical protein